MTFLSNYLIHSHKEIKKFIQNFLKILCRKLMHQPNNIFLRIATTHYKFFWQHYSSLFSIPNVKTPAQTIFKRIAISLVVILLLWTLFFSFTIIWSLISHDLPSRSSSLMTFYHFVNN